MKNIAFISIALLSLLNSCMTTTYYQVYKTESFDKIKNSSNQFSFEDKNCIISYNFWSRDGNIGFNFYNKSDENLYVNLEECFFILNGKANNYYKNRIYTSSSSSSLTNAKLLNSSKTITGQNNLNQIQSNSISSANSIGLETSQGFSVSYNEEKIVCIPPNSLKNISEYTINQMLHRDCNLLKYPKKTEIKSIKFTKSNSPIHFSNQISYSMNKTNDLIVLKNNFFISEITNYPSSEIIESRFDEFCNQKSSSTSYYLKYKSPDKFFIIYKKGQELSKY